MGGYVSFWFRYGTAAVVEGIEQSLNIEVRRKKRKDCT